MGEALQPSQCVWRTWSLLAKIIIRVVGGPRARSVVGPAFLATFASCYISFPAFQTILLETRWRLALPRGPTEWDSLFYTLTWRKKQKCFFEMLLLKKLGRWVISKISVKLQYKHLYSSSLYINLQMHSSCVFVSYISLDSHLFQIEI
jgi:hypothetical protein